MAADVLRCLEPRGGLNVVVTVGNALRGDDGTGPHIASMLSSCERLKVLDAGTNPENIVDAVISLRPSYLLFVDAADFGGFPGQARAIEKDEITSFTLSTHMFPLRVVWELIERSTDAEIRCVGIQPQDCGFKEGLTDAVRRTAEEIAGALNSRPNPFYSPED